MRATMRKPSWPTQLSVWFQEEGDTSDSGSYGDSLSWMLASILSNGWQLPFDEVLGMLLLQGPEIPLGLSRPWTYAMRQHTQVLWDRYLSCVQKIVETTLEIMFC